MELMEQLTLKLKHLRLSGLREQLEARNRQAVAESWSYLEFLSRLLEDEVERRAQKQLALRVRRGSLNSTKTLEGFDFLLSPAVNRQQVLQLATCDFVREHRNVLICGPTGVGKPHVAQALAHEAARQGYEVMFTDTHRILSYINGGRADRSWEKRLQVVLRPDLLILDDFGLRPLRSPLPEDLYDLIAGRYERASIILTSNRAPEEWPALFGDPLLASAGLDRLGDRAEALVMTGASFRSQGYRPLGKEVGSTDAR